MMVYRAKLPPGVVRLPVRVERVRLVPGTSAVILPFTRQRTRSAGRSTTLRPKRLGTMSKRSASCPRRLA
jgi:hypothetical protein